MAAKEFVIRINLRSIVSVAKTIDSFEFDVYLCKGAKGASKGEKELATTHFSIYKHKTV